MPTRATPVAWPECEGRRRAWISCAAPSKQHPTVVGDGRLWAAFGPVLPFDRALAPSWLPARGRGPAARPRGSSWAGGRDRRRPSQSPRRTAGESSAQGLVAPRGLASRGSPCTTPRGGHRRGGWWRLRTSRTSSCRSRTWAPRERPSPTSLARRGTPGGRVQWDSTRAHAIVPPPGSDVSTRAASGHRRGDTRRSPTRRPRFASP